jgi:hypothetical protein
MKVVCIQDYKDYQRGKWYRAEFIQMDYFIVTSKLKLPDHESKPCWKVFYSTEDYCFFFTDSVNGKYILFDDYFLTPENYRDITLTKLGI